MFKAQFQLMLVLSNMTNLLFLDVETTGIDAEDRICQIAFKEPEYTAVAGLVQPPLPVKLVAMSINNITNEMLVGFVQFKDSTYNEMLTKLQNTHIMVAHNAAYDDGMLKKEGINFKQTICTLKLVHYLDKECKLEKHNLSYLRYYFNLNVVAAPHDAEGDVIILEALFNKLMSLMSGTEEEKIQKMLEISSKPTLYRKFGFGKYIGQFVQDVANGGHDGKGRSWMEWLLREKMTNPQENDADWIYTLDYYLNAYAPANR